MEKSSLMFNWWKIPHHRLLTKHTSWSEMIAQGKPQLTSASWSRSLTAQLKPPEAALPGMKVTALENLSITDMMQLYSSGGGVLGKARIKSMVIVWNG